MAFLGPQRRPLILGLVAAVGVGVFYTGSISTIIPALKMIFADHETLADWLCRTETERRLGVQLPADVPNDPEGPHISSVAATSDNAGLLQEGDHLAAVDGEALPAYEAMRVIAAHREDKLPVTIRGPTGAERSVELTLAPHRWWHAAITDAAGVLPQGRSPDDRWRTLLFVMVLVVVVSLLGSLCRFANDGLIAIAVQGGLHSLRTRLAQHVFSLPLAWHSRAAQGDTLGRFSNDVSKLEVGLTTLFGKTVREPIKALGVLTLTLLIDWRILVAALAGLPFAALIIRLFGRTIKQAQRRASKSWGVVLDHLGERLSGVRVVQAYNMQEAEGRRFEREDELLTRAQRHIEVADAATKPTLEVLAIVGLSAFILYFGASVFQGELEAHMFFAAVVCLAGMFDPVRKLGNVNNRVQAADAAAARVFEVLDQAAEAPNDAELPAAPALREGVTFDGLTFTYPGNDTPVLRDVTFSLRQGETVALVGPNGAGKSTLIGLLLRYFEPDEGAILIDGRDVREFSVASLRGQCGLVTQDAVVFSGTLRENIAYGADAASDAQLAAAVRLAHLDDLVRDLGTRNGRSAAPLDAEVSAEQLSGGQKQRIALARAILRDPAILLLDEATSQVDVESERLIQEALDDVTRDRTTVIGALRSCTFARADRVVVLSGGRVVGRGSHRELVDTCETYRALYRDQFAPEGSDRTAEAPASA